MAFLLAGRLKIRETNLSESVFFRTAIYHPFSSPRKKSILESQCESEASISIKLAIFLSPLSPRILSSSLAFDEKCFWTDSDRPLNGRRAARNPIRDERNFEKWRFPHSFDCLLLRMLFSGAKETVAHVSTIFKVEEKAIAMGRDFR